METKTATAALAALARLRVSLGTTSLRNSNSTFLMIMEHRAASSCLWSHRNLHFGRSISGCPYSSKSPPAAILPHLHVEVGERHVVVEHEAARRNDLARQRDNMVANRLDLVVEYPIIVASESNHGARNHVLG